jgi:hypothetical protein
MALPTVNKPAVMAPRPSASRLASMVSKVTNTMCGITFEPATGAPPSPAMCFRVARLPISGEPPLAVVLCSDQESSATLGSALLKCDPAALEPAMIDDSLCELLNMAAGQIKNALAPDRALGLPKILSGGDHDQQAERVLRDGMTLRSRGALNLILWISNGSS